MKLVVNILFVFLLFPIVVMADPGAKPVQKPVSVKILALGDSLTEGYGVSKEAAYPALLEKLLQSEFPEKNISVVNVGISGSTSASALPRLKWLAKSNPDIVILALGANDGLRGHDLKKTKANLAKTIVFAQKNKIRVLLAAVRIPFNYGDDYRKQFAAMVPALAKKYQLSYIPFLLKGVAARKELNLSDGIHPNEKGHKIMASTVYKYIKEML